MDTNETKVKPKAVYIYIYIYRGKHTVVGTIKTPSVVLVSLYVPLWCYDLFWPWN